MWSRIVLSGLCGALLFSACGTQEPQALDGQPELAAQREALTAATADLCQVADCTKVGVTQTAWRGDYFFGDAFDYYLDTRFDPTIDFDWGMGTAMPRLSTDYFSVRWTRQNYFAAGDYEFNLTADDGVRLYVDGQLVMDDWVETAPRTRTTTVHLSEGAHTLKMEYFERTGAAVAKLTARQVNVVQPTGWTGWYYANPNLSGAPVLVRNDAVLDFNWGAGSPEPSVVPADDFSVRWYQSVPMTGGWYKITTTTDDGVRVFADGALVIDAWRVSAPFTETYTAYFPAGAHQFVVEYFEAGLGAQAKVEILPTPAPGQTCEGRWKGEYFPNPWMAGNPVERCESAVDFDWAEGAMVANFPWDHVSARWTKRMQFKDTIYVFTAEADDTMRVTVDGDEVLSFNAPDRQRVERRMSEGWKTVVVEYTERTLTARAKLSIDEKVNCGRKGNVATCTTFWPNDNGAWVELWRKETNGALTMLRAEGSINPNGYYAFHGVDVDTCRYPNGQPYVVKQYKHGQLQRQTEVAVQADQTVGMPADWACPTSDK